MHPTRQTALFLTAFGAALVTACGPTAGGGDDLNKGSYTIEEFGYEDPYGPDHHPLRGTTTAILGNDEFAVLDPGGDGVVLNHGGSTEYLDPLPPFELSATGQLDDDPPEEFLIGHYVPGVPGQAGLFSLSTLDKTDSSTWQPWGDLVIGPTAPIALATGDTDKDGRTEVAVVWDDGGAPWLSVLDDGLLVFETPLFSAYPDMDLQHIELGLADIDADGRDEIAVLGNNESLLAPVLTLFDDALTGHPQLMEAVVESLYTSWYPVPELGLFEPPLPAAPAQLALGDFDRWHAGMEICVLRLASIQPIQYQEPSLWIQYESLALDPDSGELLRWHMGAVDEGWVHLIELSTMMYGEFWFLYEPLPDSLVGFDATAADLDGDGSDELISAWFFPAAHSGPPPHCNATEAPFMVFAIPLDLTAQEVAERWKKPWHYLLQYFPRSYNPETGEWARVGAVEDVGPQHGPVSRESTTCTGWPDFQASRWSFATGDYDGDAREELRLFGFDGGWNPVTPSFNCLVEAVKDENSGRYTLSNVATHYAASQTPPTLLACDWDGDEVRVRYTGGKKLALGTPLPLVLMAAPPTKAGISQNYSGSHTAYWTSDTLAKAYALKLGTSVGVWAGCEAEDILGLTSASAKVKYEAEMAGTLKNTFTETHSSGKQTAYDEDVILFQGTLYYSYPYEVVASPNPEAIGRILTLDVPVAADTYMWTVPYYNAIVDPQYAISPEFLVHDIGAPESYMTEGQANDLLTPGQGYVGWRTGLEGVGQGGGVTFREIMLEQSAGSVLSLGWKVTGEVEYKAGPFVGGASYGAFGEAVYEVTTSQTTCFRGDVGNIKEGDYSDWYYRFGLLAYTHGLLCDENNEPIGIEEGVLPFQIETYFTQPIGPGYH